MYFTGHSFVLNVMLRPSPSVYFTNFQNSILGQRYLSKLEIKSHHITSNVKLNHYVAVYHWIPFPYRYTKLHRGSIFEFRAFAGSDTQHTHNLSLSLSLTKPTGVLCSFCHLSLSLFLSIFFYGSQPQFTILFVLHWTSISMRDGVSPNDHQGFFMHTIF